MEEKAANVGQHGDGQHGPGQEKKALQQWRLSLRDAEQTSSENQTDSKGNKIKSKEFTTREL